MTAQTSDEVTRRVVRERLDRVTDPELDRSIVRLEYVDAIEIAGNHVAVEFTLPTAWCSPAFAWMMASDARDEVETLQSVETATVTLREHVHEDAITRGVNNRRSFAEAFPDADGDVSAVRAELDRKARVARQYDAVEALLESGLDAATIVGLRLPDFETVSGDSAAEHGLGEIEDAETAAVHTDRSPGASDASERLAVYAHDRSFAVTLPGTPINHYVEKARETGLLSEPDARLFRTPEGDPIDSESFPLVHRRCRLAKVNMSSQGGICDGLREARTDRLEDATDN
ncbi:Metal-sulfur cluster biosynthetic enzyme [Natronorubrum sediminis]|uniref:Metal-sulfur cluster biosynthetic enzyme n=1 Tax=Natronorubrum sediminis TaxID=640943 RepID=A0A1H6G390_9EURY|nr:iron-sulfur cluster assembly protein [Natronorubrum sediminis]SEH17556.1 Metal-sulfur cluster biosynthetic enzyme [Natronorubrum sediminis]